MRRRFCLLVLLWVGLVGASTLYAQFRPVFYDHLDVTDGLRNGNIRSFLMSHSGLVWIGTASGLQCYNGSTLVQHPGLDEVVGNYFVSALVEDERDAIWIATEGAGLVRYDSHSHEITQFARNSGGFFPTDTVRDVEVAPDGTIWAATDMGLVHLDPEAQTTKQYRHAPDEPTTLNADDLYAVHLQAPYVWVGTRNGVARFDPTTEEAVRLFYQDEPAETRRWYRGLSFAEDRQGRVWVAFYRQGLHAVDSATLETTQYLPSGVAGHESISLQAVALHSTNDSTLWVATERSGLVEYDLANLRPRAVMLASDADPFSLPDNRVGALATGPDGDLWVGTSAGIARYDLSHTAFRTLRRIPGIEGTLPTSRSRITYADPEGYLWVGTMAGLSVFNVATNRPSTRSDHQAAVRALAQQYITAITPSSEGTMWIGTPDRGVVVLRDGQPIPFARSDAPLASSDVTFIHNDARDRMWVGTWGSGLYQYLLAEQRFVRYLPNEYPFTLSEDAEGKFWIGTWENGLLHFDPDTQLTRRWAQSTTAPHGLRNNRVRATWVSPDRVLWIGTSNGGVQTFDLETEAFSVPVALNAVIHDQVYGFASDDRQHLWVVTEHSLLRYHLEEEAVDVFGPADGLPASSFNVNSTAGSANGFIYIGSNAGVIRVAPDQLPPGPLPKVQPRILINSYALDDTVQMLHVAAGEAQRIEMDPERQWLRVDYSALSFLPQRDYTFAYALTAPGQTPRWQSNGTFTQLTLSRPPPRNYTLHLITTDVITGIQSEPVQLGLMVRPMYWETWWFRILVLLGFFSVIGSIYMVRTRSLKRHAQALQAEIDQRTIVEEERLQLIDRLVEAREEAEEMGRLKTELLNNMSHEIRTPLTGIIGLSELLATEADIETIGLYGEMIHANGARLLETLDSVLIFSQLESGVHQPSFTAFDAVTATQRTLDLYQPQFKRKSLNLTVDFGEVAIPMVSDRSFYDRILTNLLSNALKFTRNGGVHVALVPTADTLTLTVADTGIGIAPHLRERIFEDFVQASSGYTRSHEGVGLGLAITARLTAYLQGSINIDATYTQGTAFVVTLPLEPVVSATTPKTVEAIGAAKAPAKA